MQEIGTGSNAMGSTTPALVSYTTVIVSSVRPPVDLKTQLAILETYGRIMTRAKQAEELGLGIETEGTGPRQRARR